MKGDIIMKRIALAAAIALSALSLFAYDLTGTGLSANGQRTEDGKTLDILADSSGGAVVFDVEADPAPDRIAALGAIVAEIRSWKDFQAAELRAINTADRLQVIAAPKSFLVGGVELAAAIPGGVQLFFDKATEYDFKVKSGKYLVRVASVFTTEAELAAAALAAYKDPASFIATRDPLYVQKVLDDYAARLDELEKATFGETTSQKEAKTSLAEQEIAAIKEKDAQRDADWAKGKAAILAALNGAKPINPDAVAKLVELKQADPTLDKKGAPKALKAAGVTMSNQEIAAVFLVEFGEY